MWLQKGAKRKPAGGGKGKKPEPKEEQVERELSVRERNSSIDFSDYI